MERKTRKLQETSRNNGRLQKFLLKTDHDATFMRMKEDHMKNGQLKPAYNIQLASASGFIIGENISHHPSDMNTLKPFLKDLLEKNPNKLNKIVADAGYESEENYVFLAEKI